MRFLFTVVPLRRLGGRARMTTTSDTALYLSNDDLYLLGAGEWYRSYEKLGSHPATGRAAKSQPRC